MSSNMDLLRRRSPYSYTGSQCPTVADSVIGLIILLYEVAMPHINLCSLWPILLRLIIQSNRSSNANKVFRTDIFSLFSPSQYMAKKERKNIIHLSKSHFRRRRVYRTISFHKNACQNLFCTNIISLCSRGTL